MEYGRYHIVKELGKGTMGVVYLAHDPQIDRQVALKVMQPDRMLSQAFVARFVKEARAIGRLSHSRIVTVFDVGQDHGSIYIAMEYLKGRPLNEVMQAGRMTVEQCTDIAAQVADALDYAHRRGVVHRDIKPSNIILSDEEQVKLTDFGIAHLEDGSAGQQTQAGEILGTPVYMPPEQVLGQSVDGRSDLYSAGVILYEMILGCRPFGGNTIAAIFKAITQDEPEPPEAIDPFIQPSLSAVMMKSLAKKPEERFQTGRQMAQALQAFHNPVQTSDTVKPPVQVQGHPAKGVIYGLIALVLLGIGMGGYYWLRPQVPSAGRDVVSPSRTPEIPPVDLSAVTETVTNTTESGPSAAQPAKLKLTSEPAGAQVFVDNGFKGKTPLDLQLPLGKYELRLNLPDYLEWEAQIDLDAVAETPLHISLRPLQ